MAGAVRILLERPQADIGGATSRPHGAGQIAIIQSNGFLFTPERMGKLIQRSLGLDPLI